MLLRICSFLLLSGILLYEYTTLFIHELIDKDVCCFQLSAYK